MTAPKKKPAARKKPAAKKPVADPTAKQAAEAAQAKDPVTPEAPEKVEPPQEEKKASKLPGYLNKTVLVDKERKELIEDFNKSFDSQFPNNLKDVKVLKNMQNRLLKQVYNK